MRTCGVSTMKEGVPLIDATIDARFAGVASGPPFRVTDDSRLEAWAA